MKEEAMTESVLQSGQPQVASAATEATHTGPLVAPPVDIYENGKSITLLADMPGVSSEHLEIDLNEGVLTITGRVAPVEEAREEAVLYEYRPATFQRKFTLSQTVDQGKIEARLEDGVLHLELPKVEKAQPRKIQVKG
jgi:HSP20 family molecular chaperone IbpA